MYGKTRNMHQQHIQIEDLFSDRPRNLEFIFSRYESVFYRGICCNCNLFNLSIQKGQLQLSKIAMCYIFG